ncbi:hypothetical protein K457DRAFT_155004 [Linnemannia elongata AG-77]|uniref:NADH-ubiquinone oxidoreductase 21kDa subunit N-terminal domain-containing protein n=1 Tax=Linnemannia elongata AG-77 TaxID=1314771 RepID=A0A197JYY1_9FUNG|nr:hypothetical protein K457DRAFT_155004 [Linnemannia elongata AG-77]
MSSAEQYIRTEFPVIDSDPHFNRVISYMRGSDVVAWGGLTAAAPAALLALGNQPSDEYNNTGGIAPQVFISERSDEAKDDEEGEISRTLYLADTSGHVNWEATTNTTGIERVRPAAGPKGINFALGLATAMGFMGGFLYSYQKSSLRFWGWEENVREQAMNRKEMDARAAAGLPAYGEPTMDETAQAAAARNSKFAALKFAAIPWFNTTNHKYHLADTTPNKSE